MGRRVWMGAAAGVVAAVIAWLISYPYLPVRYIDITDPKSLNTSVESHYTLGTFYGWFSNGLFGLLASLFIVVVYTAKLPLRQRILPCLIAVFLGALWVAGGDALSDSFCIMVSKGSMGGALAGLFLAPFFWALVMSIALCSSIVVSMAMRMDLIGRLFLAIGICTVACIVLRMIVGEVTQLFVFASLIGGSGRINVWAMTAPSFLASHVAIGAAAGASLGLADIVSRKAWIRLSLGAKEGYTWTVDSSMSIGTSELADIRISKEGGTMPMHAQIDVKGNRYLIRHLGGPVPTYVNNTPVQAVELGDGDIIRIGFSDLVFHIRNHHAQGLQSQPAQQVYSYDPLAFQLIDPIGNIHAVNQGKTIIGRDPSCGLSLPWETTMSAYHAELSMLVEDLTIRDLGSTNGTKVNGMPIANTPVPIKTGDTIELGSVRLQVHSNRPLL